MTLVPYDPFHLMRRQLGTFPFLPRLFSDDWLDASFDNMGLVRVEVSENQAEVVVKAELPGLEKKEDLQITVHDNHLHLSGKIERSAEEKDEKMHRTERYYGHFSRLIPLPSPVDDSRARASYRNGILEIRLPKIQRPTGNQIEVEFH